jgi:hypothetical protein
MDTDKCGNCEQEVTTDSDFCPHCGVFFESSPAVACAADGDREADGVCVICQKFVCERCGVQVLGRWLCGDHQNVELREDFAMVFQSSQFSSSGVVKSTLEDAGFQVIDMNWRARGGRYNKLYVPIPDFVKASEILKDIQAV